MKMITYRLAKGRQQYEADEKTFNKMKAKLPAGSLVVISEDDTKEVRTPTDGAEKKVEVKVVPPAPGAQKVRERRERTVKPKVVKKGPDAAPASGEEGREQVSATGSGGDN